MPEEEENLSPNEALAQQFEVWQKQYLDLVDRHFSTQDKPRGEIAYIQWENRFLEFLGQSFPSLFQSYKATVRMKSGPGYFGQTVHQNWKAKKGDAIEAFLTQAIEDARAGRLADVLDTPGRRTPPLANTLPKINGDVGKKVAIAHGNSNAWKELKDFLNDRLNLEWDEFNREPPAGLATTARLEQMLDSACFAFIVMTAEDRDPDGTLHARENVIHEAGLFQGRLGFARAIILLEQECAEFSNIKGLTQIRFPKGNIKSISEDIRQILERERLLKKV